ncbi:YpjP family protein [Lederbergia citrea]|uniref:YpjP family protein n=1 Tax=Lederbergia citrea TaxID=2833581 RepID=UPI001BC93F49|nr:YpjP family protein [Lederbergia citrea]MBS4176632.1 YpjP family protein [Lederbergia citrea]MBS4203193.1 YpjP family protein [Lederbergia citrea]
MKLWLRKSLIILVSILTFGAVTPSHALWSENHELSKSQQRGSAPDEPSRNLPVETALQADTRLKKNQFIAMMTNEAERQSIMKFGPKISTVIEDEFREVILPNIEAAIEMTSSQFPEEALANLSMTEMPGGGTSEKIFHIFNAETNKDVIRFHVRRDKPPLEGYTFNFHYHTYHDDFQSHYTIGTIYWDKNTPPNWQSV